MVQSCSVVFNPNIKSCLVNLAPAWVKALSARSTRVSDIVLEVAWTESGSLARKKAYVGWSGLACAKGFFDKHAPDEVLELDAAFASALGLKDRQKVSVEFIRPPAMATRVDVEPVSEDDWEILMLHAGYLEEKLLSQVRVVYSGQVITVWIEGQAQVRLKVSSTEPNDKCVRLGNDVEIVVAPRERRHKVNNEQVHEISEPAQPTTVQKETASLRCLPLEHFDVATGIEDDFLTIGVHPNVAPKFQDVVFVKNQTAVMAPDSETPSTEELVPRVDGVYVRCKPMDKIPADHVLVGPELRQILHAVPYDRLGLSTATTTPTKVTQIIARKVRETRTFRGITIGGKKKAADEELKAQLVQDLHAYLEACANPVMLITDKMLCHVPLLSSAKGDDFDVARVVLQLPSGTSGYGVVSSEEARGIKIEVGEDFVDPTETDKPVTQSLLPTSLPVLGGVDPILAKAEEYIKMRLGCTVLKTELGAPLLGGLLLYGGHGCGKTSLVQHLVYTLSRSMDTLAYCTIMACGDYADERASKVKEHFEEVLSDAVVHAPSIVVFDDLDALIMGEQEHMDTARYKQLAAMFVDVAAAAKQSDKIILVATCKNPSNLHPMVVESHVFDETVHISPPTKKDRRDVLQALMRGAEGVGESIETLDLTSIASMTEGYLAADLKTLVERAVHAAAVRTLNQGMVDFELRQCDFEEGQKGYIPSSLRGVKLQQSETSWADIGGLHETRRVLKETLEWPTKYAAIFANSPLRLRSGLLLYGYPGCGKTLLASAVAKECGLNFISVKGPELLNKYIGASEAAVRDLFERAQAARPCILFFDEFDAIAPKRGHDNTGVTDRVVNQLLTQMDGAEKVEGVYVLAATSRPDLIDAALLRPGRLDKSLLCGMPDAAERLDILNAVARKLELGSVDLNAWAEATDGYSGADLQALLYNAHLAAIHEQMTSFERDEVSASTDQVDFSVVSMTQLARAAPRMTAAERSHWTTRLAAIQSELTRVEATDVEREARRAHKRTVIDEAHVASAFETLRPSVSPQDRIRLERVYVACEGANAFAGTTRLWVAVPRPNTLDSVPRLRNCFWNSKTADSIVY